MFFTSMNEKTSRGQSDERGLKAQALPAAQAAACDRDGSARAYGRPWCQSPEGNRHIHSPSGMQIAAKSQIAHRGVPSASISPTSPMRSRVPRPR